MQFKVGDRVRVYWYGNASGEGTVRQIHDRGMTVRMDTETDFLPSVVIAHPKQCRKLKLKVKKERMRIWVPKSWEITESYVPATTCMQFLLEEPDDSLKDKYYEFQEVLPWIPWKKPWQELVIWANKFGFFGVNDAIQSRR